MTQTVVLLVGVLIGFTIAWIWYVISEWLDRPRRVELDDTLVRFQKVSDHHEPSWLITDTGRQVHPPGTRRVP